jgi:hypothetical protein
VSPASGTAIGTFGCYGLVAEDTAGDGARFARATGALCPLLSDSGTEPARGCTNYGPNCCSDSTTS